MNTIKINSLAEAKAAIIANGGKAPKSIRRCRVERKPLVAVGTKAGHANQRGYEVGGVYYATVADIMSA